MRNILNDVWSIRHESNYISYGITHRIHTCSDVGQSQTCLDRSQFAFDRSHSDRFSLRLKWTIHMHTTVKWTIHMLTPLIVHCFTKYSLCNSDELLQLKTSVIYFF